MNSKAEDLYKVCAERGQRGQTLFTQSDLENLRYARSLLGWPTCLHSSSADIFCVVGVEYTR
jgi:hypothetical protein